MLGSAADAEDALQETLLRAWRALPRFEGRSALSSWLYRIATNVCLRMIERRPRRALPMDAGGEPAWLEPYPDAALEGPASPEARYEQRESVELAFAAALQHLPPRQRAVLLLRDVLGFAPAEIAEALESSPASVYSVLQRARAAVEERLPARSQQATLRTVGDAKLRAIVERYVKAWEAGDVASITAMLTADATFAMPPLAEFYVGRAAIGAFLAAGPMARAGRWRHLPLTANGQAACRGLRGRRRAGARARHRAAGARRAGRDHRRDGVPDRRAVPALRPSAGTRRWIRAGARIQGGMTRRSSSAWVLALAALASCMTALDTLVVATSLTTIRLDLGASVEQLEWTVNAYNLSFAVLLMTAAALGDRLGRRRMFAGGVVLFTLASAACALAPSVGALIAARAVQGAGAALVMTLGLALVSAAFAPEKRAAALGIFFALTGLAVASGPLIGGAVAEGLAWQWIFWLNVPIGAVVAPLALARMQESFGPDRGLDLPGLALVSGGVLGLVWGLVRGNTAGWGSPEVVGALAAGAVALAAFVRWELRATAPMLPMAFFRSRAFSAGNAAIFFVIGGLFTGVFFFAQFMQTGLGHGPLDAGLMLLPWTATLFFVAPVAGKLVERFGERVFMTVGPLLQAAGMGWIALVADAGVAYVELVPPLIIAGVGVSMSFPAAQNSVVGSVPPEAIGKASGVNSTMRELGGVFGIALSVAVFSAAGSYASPDAFADGFSAAITVSFGLSLAAAVAGAALPGRPPRRVVPGVPALEGES